MPGNALAIFENAQLPAHISTMNEDSANIVARATVNTLVRDNTSWTINLDGKKTKLMRKTGEEGEEEPVSILSVVVLDYNKERGRELYLKKYDPQNPTIPDCWSEDGKAPHANVPEKQSVTCAACPKSQKGSTTNQQGQPAVACGQFQKLAVVPANGLKDNKYPPLRLRLKITSIFDKSGADKHPNWFAWQQYLDLLTSKGVRSTGLLPTKLKQDPDVSYSKILFSPGKDWLDEESLAIVKELMTSDEVKNLLAETYDPSTSRTGNKPLPAEPEEETEVAAAEPPKQAAVSAKAKAKPAAPPPPADEDEEEATTTTAAPAAEEEEEPTAEQQAAGKRADAAKANVAATNAALAKAAQKAAAAKTVPVDDEDEETTMPPPVKPKAAAAAAPGKATGGAKATPAKGAVEAPKDVADMLDGWDDE